MTEYAHVYDEGIDGKPVGTGPTHLLESSPGARIHPEARVVAGAGLPGPCVGRGASVGRGVVLHPGVVVEADAVVEEGVLLGPGAVVGAGSRVRRHAVLDAGTHLGRGVEVWQCAALGAAPESRVHPRAGSGGVWVGDDSIIREFVTVHAPTTGSTRIGRGCFVMCHSHVGHDAVLEDGVTLSPAACIGGHAQVHRGAVIGMHAQIHQRGVVGVGAMVGMGASAARDVPPWVVFHSGRAQRVNEVGLKRAGRTAGEVDDLRGWYRAVAGVARASEQFRQIVDASGVPEWCASDARRFAAVSARGVADTAALAGGAPTQTYDL